MAWKDWGVPLIAAIVTFTGLWALDVAPTSTESQAASVRWAFADVHVLPGNHTFLGIRTAEEFGCLKAGDHDEQPRPDLPFTGDGNVFVGVNCPGPGLVQLIFDVGPGEVDLQTPGLHVMHAVPGPRLAIEGYNATRVTVHAFDADGNLVFSNGNVSEQARLVRNLSPEQLPTGVWYLGRDATAPPGTQKPPLLARAFLGQVRPLIDGLPEGGVATTQTDALANLYGTLFVTLRVDKLVHAP